jgi:hypothetical protein
MKAAYLEPIYIPIASLNHLLCTIDLLLNHVKLHLSLLLRHLFVDQLHQAIHIDLLADGPDPLVHEGGICFDLLRELLKLILD